MALSRRETDALIKAVSLTRPDEATCEGCLKQLAEFAERALEGKTVPEGLQAIEHHLSLCAECQEEYQALLTALKQEE